MGEVVALPGACQLTTKVGVYDLTPFTMLDYAGELACLIWFAGCNLRCAYCHNPHMVRAVGSVPWARVEHFLTSRKGKLTGVVLTGGEATLHPDIVAICQQIKRMGFKIKLDTNGTRPAVVKTLLHDNLLDYVALDYKAPRGRFSQVTGVGPERWDAFSETLGALIAHNVPFEARTTVHTDLLTETDVDAIRADLTARGYTGAYYVQNFRPCEATLGNLPLQSRVLDTAPMQAAAERVRVEIRNFG